MANEVRLIDANAFLTNQMRIARAKETEEQRAYWAGVDDTLGDIVDAPTIDPESLRPKAKWLRYTKKINGQDVCFVRCNRCRTERAFDYGLVYCNHCGAKMEG